MIKSFRIIQSHLDALRQSFLEATNWGILQTIEFYGALIGLALIGFAFAGGSLCDLFHITDPNNIAFLIPEGMIIVGIVLIWFCVPSLIITCIFGLVLNMLWLCFPWAMVGVSILIMRLLHRLLPNRFDDPLDDI